jgi:hypothetical protein
VQQEVRRLAGSAASAAASGRHGTRRSGRPGLRGSWHGTHGNDMLLTGCMDPSRARAVVDRHGAVYPGDAGIATPQRGEDRRV